VSETVLLWILGSLGGGLILIGKLMWDHVQHCKEVHGKLAEIGGDVKRLMADVGTHETGMRGTLHSHASVLTRHELDIENMKRRENQR
jgi:hypothetical protein